MNGTVPNRGDTKVSEVVNGKERPPQPAALVGSLTARGLPTTMHTLPGYGKSPFQVASMS